MKFWYVGYNSKWWNNNDGCKKRIKLNENWNVEQKCYTCVLCEAACVDGKRSTLTL
jgi:glucan phosphoethanolaminetransferase (alkaline phosphatase superfamily)